MRPLQASVSQDEALLGELAMKFRGTRSETEREEIAKSFCETVDRLIDSKKWLEIPPLEDLLPDAWMPKAFFAYWFR